MISDTLLALGLIPSLSVGKKKLNNFLHSRHDTEETREKKQKKKRRQKKQQHIRTKKGGGGIGALEGRGTLQ